MREDTIPHAYLICRDVNVSFFVNETFGFCVREKNELLFFLGKSGASAVHKTFS
jgi:hypothetical protein